MNLNLLRAACVGMLTLGSPSYGGRGQTESATVAPPEWFIERTILIVRPLCYDTRRLAVGSDASPETVQVPAFLSTFDLR